MMAGYLLGANEHGHGYTCMWQVKPGMGIWGWVHPDTMHMSKANGLRAQKMLTILGSIVNMIGGGDLYYHFMSKKSSL